MLEPLESQAGLDAPAPRSGCPGLPVPGQGVGLPPRPVEGPHELRPEGLAQRGGGDRRFELGSEVAVTPEGQLRIEAGLEGGQAKLVEAGGLRARERLVEVGERRPAPQADSVPRQETLGRAAEVALRGRGTPGRNEPLKLTCTIERGRSRLEV